MNELEKRQLFEISVTNTEQFMLGLPQTEIEVRHDFADGMYRRTAIAPKDTVIITRVHKRDNFAFVMTGEVTILTEDGATRIKAPGSFITKAGTKRVILAHEDSLWYTVHCMPNGMNPDTDIEEIENYFSCDTIEQYEQHLLEVPL